MLPQVWQVAEAILAANPEIEENDPFLLTGVL
jgi:phage tail protein X